MITTENSTINSECECMLLKFIDKSSCQGHNNVFLIFHIPAIAGGLEEWISDGSCDDINNNVPCKFDGGDCCGLNPLKQYCFECSCIGNFCQAMKK